MLVCEIAPRPCTFSTSKLNEMALHCRSEGNGEGKNSKIKKVRPGEALGSIHSPLKAEIKI